MRSLLSIAGFCVLLGVLSLNARAQSGLVYVLDSGGRVDKPQILQVDPAQKQIVRKFATQHSPDMALSPDGTRLYVASTDEVSGRLEIFDTSSGKLLRSLDNKDRWLPTTALYISHMKMSPDGKWLYIFKYEIPTDMYYISTFDTTREAFLEGQANLPECLNSVMSPSSEGRQLAVMCTSADDLRFVKIMEDGKGKVSRLPLRLRGRTSRFGLSIGLSNLVPTTQGYKAVLGDGSFFDVNSESKRINSLGVLDGKTRKISYNESPSIVAEVDDWMGGKWLPIQYPALAKSGKVYLGISQLADIRRASWAFSQIGVFDPDTLNRVSVIDLNRRVFSIAVNPAGDRLYAIDPYTKTLIVFDAASGKEMSTVEGIGESPTIVIAAP